MAVRHIGVYMDLVGSYGRGVALGIAQYAGEAGNWHVIMPATWPMGQETRLATSRVDGWIAYTGYGLFRRAIRCSPAPVIGVSTVSGKAAQYPAVISDHPAISHMAMQHLLDRGHTRCAFVGHDTASAHQRRDAFAARAADAGMECPSIVYSYDSSGMGKLRRWLQQLPKPVGVMADSDVIGELVLEACNAGGIAIPQEVAVISVDNDPLICLTRIPKLTSIQLNLAGIGYEAARLLDRTLDGDKPPSRPVLVPPQFVATRESTDSFANVDKEVRRALEFIRSRRGHAVRSRDVLENALLSERTLQLRFRAQMGCSIQSFIRRARVEHAAALLVRTRDSVKTIALQSGFSNATLFGIAFKQVTGVTPRRYQASRTS